MERLHAPNEFFRVRGLRDGMRAWEELRRRLADGPHRPASREGDDGCDASRSTHPARQLPHWPRSSG
jgi:hypothetical protein